MLVLLPTHQFEGVLCSLSILKLNRLVPSHSVVRDFSLNEGVPPKTIAQLFLFSSGKKENWSTRHSIYVSRKDLAIFCDFRLPNDSQLCLLDRHLVCVHFEK